MTLLRALAMIAISMAITAVILLGWIGLVFVVNTSTPVAMTAEAALNLMLLVLLTLVGLPILHAVLYRWFWHVRRRTAQGAFSVGQAPAFGSEPTAPPPRTVTTAGLCRRRRAAFVMAGFTAFLAGNMIEQFLT